MRELIITVIIIPNPMVKATSGTEAPVVLNMIVPRSDLVRIQLSLGSSSLRSMYSRSVREQDFNIPVLSTTVRPTATAMTP